jgi:hypothetical protein
MTWLMLWLAIGAAFQDAAPGPQEARPRQIDRGDLSLVDGPQQVVVRTPAEWEALWRRHAPDRPLPMVDFTREMVVAVFAGSRPTAGYSVDVVEASRAGDALLVRYRVTRPGRDVLTAQIITSPYYIGAVPRHPGEVRFEAVQP